MYLNDPFQPVQAYQEREARPPDPLREFFSEYPYSGRGHTTGPRQPPAMLGLCRFVNGREVDRGRDCPHYREPEDVG